MIQIRYFPQNKCRILKIQQKLLPTSSCIFFPHSEGFQAVWFQFPDFTVKYGAMSHHAKKKGGGESQKHNVDLKKLH